MKAGIGTRNNDIESITDDSTPDKLNTDEVELIPDEVNPDKSSTDDPNPDNQEDLNATVEGEQHQDNSFNYFFNNQETQFRIHQILMIYQEMLQERSQIEGEHQSVQKVIEQMQGEHLVLVICTSEQSMTNC